MDKDQVIAVLQNHAAEIRARGAHSLYLFGSTARGEAGAASDVDLMVDIDQHQKFSLLDQAGLQVFLSDVLQCEADVSIRGTFHPLISDQIEAEAIRVL